MRQQTKDGFSDAKKTNKNKKKLRQVNEPHTAQVHLSLAADFDKQN